ncbi:MAG TPA: DUF4351 domain-containing protein [Blastocatellia bacterium]|nr:DUF4351 domain-containing protein [Blastocatellia bacterium]
MTTTKKQDAAPVADQDSAWKELITEYLPAFLAFFFPAAHAEIDWTRKYESLDKELAKLRPADEARKIFADKLFKVWLRNGKPVWLLIHVEIQGRAHRGFAKRVFQYFYRILEERKSEVVSLVVLTGESPGQTGQYTTSHWGCAMQFDFPTVRGVDFADRWNELEKSLNPFAVAVQAQLKAHGTKGDNAQRYKWKKELIFGLYQRGFNREEIVNLLKFMDWIVTLPPQLDEELKLEVYEFEEKSNMQSVSNWERLFAVDFTTELLAARVGTISSTLKTRLRELTYPQLVELGLASANFQKKSDLTAWLKAQTNAQPTTRKRRSHER